MISVKDTGRFTVTSEHEWYTGGYAEQQHNRLTTHAVFGIADYLPSSL